MGPFMTVIEIVENKMKADAVALVHFVRCSEEEALRLGVSGVVVEFLRMARIELINTIEKEGLEEVPIRRRRCGKR
jgi:hypothetical protein